MEKMCLLIDQPDSLLERASQGVLCLRDKSGVPYKVGLNSIDSVIIQRETTIKSSALRECIEADVDLVIVSSGRMRGEAVVVQSQSHRLRMQMAQMMASNEAESRLSIAKSLVLQKLLRQDSALARQGLVNCLAQSIEKVPAATNLNHLMGIEGSAAKRYFKAWGSLWQAPFAFTGRNRRPPKDPVNALMSLSYTLALQKVGNFANRHGLDAKIGFLHHPLNHTNALCLDVLELLRADIDAWVWSLFNQRHLFKKEHFEISQFSGCRLNKAGRSRYYMAWQYDHPSILLPGLRLGVALLKRHLKPFWHKVRQNYDQHA